MTALQVEASEPLKKNIWKQTVEAKLKNQAALLKILGKDESPVLIAAGRVKSGDATNREAVAARYYWNEIFGDPFFQRERYGDYPNALLNYGYAILRAAVARALTGSGLLPSLGIHHHNKYNAFCLADDLMEPYRPYVDHVVYTLSTDDADSDTLTREQKTALLEVLQEDVMLSRIKRPLLVALSCTTASLVKCLAGEAKKMNYPVLC